MHQNLKLNSRLGQNSLRPWGCGLWKVVDSLTIRIPAQSSYFCFYVIRTDEIQLIHKLMLGLNTSFNTAYTF